MQMEPVSYHMNESSYKNESCVLACESGAVSHQVTDPCVSYHVND